jgi:hypothetical protein
MAQDQKLIMLAKDVESGRNGCPSVHLDDDTGMLVLLGPEAEAGTFSQLENVLPGERAILLRPDVVLRAADAFRARSAG